jgi:ATP-dependent helicase/nuclease subunit A
VRQAPLTAKLGAMPRFVERAEALYARAAQEELNAASAANASWRKFLDYLDNDADRVVRLLATMLGKRDQWLRHVITGDASALRAGLEASLATEIARELVALDALFPRNLRQVLLEHARFAATNLRGTAPAHPLVAFSGADALPAPIATELGRWQALAGWLLTKNGDFIAKLTVAHGFPAKGKARSANSEERVARKRSMESLLDALRAVPGLAQALNLVRQLPPPRYDEAGWAFVEALLDILPRAAARLRHEFALEGAIDFAEATLVALQALGTDTPSDLLLAMDMRISHLLVDEFQDISSAQCDLIMKLTTGWDPGDGRTLFLVGDPMQSIYGFREANVGLFVAALHDRRLGSVTLEPLTLSRNFRSRPGLVEWVNRVFSQVLPSRDDPARGAVAFKAAVATLAIASKRGVTLDLVPDMRQEARAVVAHVEAALQDGMKSIAVLVRKRLDLEEILPALRASGIEFNAVGLDRLSERPALLDLLSLTHALLQPSDQLAWLSVLRAPWCGLTLNDLFALASLRPTLPDLFTGGDEADGLAGLSTDGRARLARFKRAVASALRQRGRVSLTMLVRGTWLALGGPACVAEPIDLSVADRYFELLATHAKGGDVPDWHALTDSLAAVHVEPDASAIARVQIMTLHRAKGLEFDVVVMPGLTRRPKGADEQLLLWRERPSGLLLAPLHARTPETEKNTVYAYVRSLAADEEAAELGRLLYVGCTRAKERLHLTAQASIDDRTTGGCRWRPPAKGTSLAALWPAIAHEAPSTAPPPTATLAPAATTGVPLQRLPIAWRLPSPPPAIAVTRSTAVTAEREAIAFDWARETARQVGIVAHRLLRQIADDGIAQWDDARVTALSPRVELEFGLIGFTADEARRSAALVVEGIGTTLDDPQGRWLFDSRHADAKSEYALTGERDGSLVRVVLDRTFVDVHGTRWIVDFKLSRHEGGDRDAFLDSERDRYRQQLEDYARVVRGVDDRPIRVGLYFPLLRGWREWGAPV